MIIYDLECIGGHRFEGWFPNAAAFEKQQAEGLVFCAVCGLSEVKRIPTAGIQLSLASPASGGQAARQAKKISREEKEISANVDPVVLLKMMDHYVRSHFKDVGAEFAKKALDIHHGVSPREAIFGTTTPEEKNLLDEEGVPFASLPKLPESTKN